VLGVLRGPELIQTLVESFPRRPGKSRRTLVAQHGHKALCKIGVEGQNRAEKIGAHEVIDPHALALFTKGEALAPQRLKKIGNALVLNKTGVGELGTKCSYVNLSGFAAVKTADVKPVFAVSRIIQKVVSLF